MPKLTKRTSGLGDGFQSGYKRNELVLKLGTLEHEAPGMISEICTRYCKHPEQLDSSDLYDVCEGCPLSRLVNLLD